MLMEIPSDWVDARRYADDYWVVSADFTYPFRHLFPNCGNNHDVTDVLVAAGVVQEEHCDSEFSEAVFFFKTQADLDVFLEAFKTWASTVVKA